MSDRLVVKQQLLGLLATALLVMVGFQNCSPVGFEQTPEKASSLGTPGNPGTDDSLGIVTPEEQIVAKACQDSTIYTTTNTISFPRPTKDFGGSRCNWENDGNGKKVNGKFQARLEQTQSVSLPANTKICDVQFSAPTQDWRYDDHVFVAMDDVLLASSHPIHDRLTRQSGLSIYSWDKIYQQDWEQIPAYIWCVGMDSGLANCSWPASETSGEISLSFAAQLFQKIAARDLTRNTHEFKFITTGDNDGDLDCDHSDLSFDVQIKYSY